MPHGAIPFPFGDCRVCSDKATGVHYGVATCEGCKGFFKRSLPKAEKYRCFNNGQCTFDRNDRNRCKSCRFRRCLDVGMSLEGVKMGRIPKVDKERALEQHRMGADVDGVPYSEETAPRNLDSASSSITSDHRSALDELPKSPGHTPLSGDSGIDDAPINPSSLGAWCQNQGRFFPSESSRVKKEEKVKLFESSSSSSGMTAAALAEKNWNATEGTRWSRGSPTFSARLDTQNPSDQWMPAGPVRGESMEGQRARYSGNPVASQNPWAPPTWMGTDRQGSLPMSDEMNPLCVSNLLTVSYKPSPLAASVTDPSSTYSRVRYTEKPDSSGLGIPSSLRFSGAAGPVPPPETRMNGMVEESSLLPRRSSFSSQDGHQLSPYGPNVIRELLDQVIQTGHARELQHNIARQFVSTSTTTHSPPIFSTVLHRTGSVGSNFGIRKRPSSSAGACSSPPPKIERLAAESCQSELLDPVSGNPEVEKSDGIVSSSSVAGTWRSSDMVAAKASSPSGFALLPFERPRPAGGATTSATEVDGHTPGKDCEIISFDESFFRLPAEYNCRDELGNVVDIEVPIIRLPDTVPDGDFGTEGFAGAELESRRSEIDAVLLCLQHVSDVFMTTIKMSEEILRQEENGLRPRHPLNLADKSEPGVVVKVWNDLMNSVPVVNSYVLGMCMHIPGFGELEQKDKATLMEAAYFEMWLIQWARLFTNNDVNLRLASGVRYSRQLIQLFMPDSLVASLQRFAEALNSCHLTPVEHTILCAIQLTNTSGRSLMDVQRVQKLHDYYLDLLAYEIERNHRASHSRILIKIFQLLPMLTPINHEQAEAIMNYRVDSPPEISMRSDRSTSSTSSCEGSSNCSPATSAAATKCSTPAP